MTNLINWFIENKYTSIKDTGMKWHEVGAKFNLSGEAARGQFRNWKARNDLVLTNETKVNGITKFEKYKVQTEKDELNLSDFKVTKVTKNPNGQDWITYVKDNNLTRADIDDMLSDIDFPLIRQPTLVDTFYETIQIVNIGDIHIGMCPKGSLFNIEWSMRKVYDRMDYIADRVSAKTCVLNMLGDYTDGINGKTSRGGHTLQQNMNDKEKFKHGLESAIYLIKRLKAHNDRVVVNWLSNSNHPGFMDYAIGNALEIIFISDEDVEVNNIEKFITPFNVKTLNGEITLFLTHGYDEEFMKQGWPRFLNEQQKNGVRNIGDHFKSLKQMEFDSKPILIRADQHQYHDIDYQQFRDIMIPAFSPPSGWVQQNFFNKDEGGFLIHTITEDKLVAQLIPF